MIQFTYEHPKNNDYEGVLTVHVHETASQYYSKEQFPLRLMHKTLMGEIPWHSDLQPGWWSQYTMLTYTTLEVIDNLGNKLIDWKWDPFTHGDIAHQMFEIWSMNNRGSNGIAIGTHNGMTGEWVGPINKGLIKGTLVEASELQFNDLYKFYNNKTWVKCRKELVTTDGSDVIFYEADCVDRKQMDDIFNRHKPSYVYHMAAYAAEGLSPFPCRQSFSKIARGGIAQAGVRNACAT
jgi:hypothetical protein